MKINLITPQSSVHRDLVLDWLNRPHVMRWWGDSQRGISAFDACRADQHAMIAVDSKPVGYLRWQPVDRQDLDAVGLHEIPDDAVDCDIFIGEPEWLAKGIGPNALQLLANRLNSENRYSMLGLCTSVENSNAVQAFKKAGFQSLRQYDDPVYGRCYVMTLNLKHMNCRSTAGR